MRFVVAMFKHETNTFSPVPTPLGRFGDGGPYWGADARRAYEGTNTPIGAFLDIAEARGAEVVTPVAAEAWPSGPVDDDAFEACAGAICAAVAQGCDAAFLDLHGAMVTASHDDGEGTLLARIRAIAPELPIAVTFDYHANVTAQIVGNCTVLTGFKTYPHVDMYDVGKLAGDILVGALDGQVEPVMVWGNRPMLPHVMRQATEDEPCRELIAMARRAEAEGALAVSLFPGFPHADIHDAGLSVVVVTDGDAARAEAIRERLLDRAWDRRAELVYEAEPLDRSVAQAKSLGLQGNRGGPVLLLDHSDNCGSGGTQDVMAVIAEVLRQELDDIAIFAVHDPAAVAQMIAAGVGSQVELTLGGKHDMPSIGERGQPLAVSGRVRLISDGEFTIRGPMYTGVRVGMGRAAVLDTGKVEIVVIERHHEPWDLGCLRCVGIEPTQKRYIMLKSRVHYRAGFKPIARAIIDCAGTGVTTSDYGRLTFTKLRRPIYPLDPDAAA